MTSSYLSLLDEMFDETAFPSKEKLMNFVDQTVTFFREMKTKFESKDPQKREEAIQESLEIKKTLESKMSAFSEKTGLDMTQLSAIMQKVASAEERNMIEDIQSKFQELQKDEKASPKKPIYESSLIR